MLSGCCSRSRSGLQTIDCGLLRVPKAEDKCCGKQSPHLNQTHKVLRLGHNTCSRSLLALLEVTAVVHLWSAEYACAGGWLGLHMHLLSHHQTFILLLTSRKCRMPPRAPVHGVV